LIDQVEKGLTRLRIVEGGMDVVGLDQALNTEGVNVVNYDVWVLF
jgi:hypothetical protein